MTWDPRKTQKNIMFLQLALYSPGQFTGFFEFENFVGPLECSQTTTLTRIRSRGMSIGVKFWSRKILTVIFVGISHIRKNGGSQLCEFSQDPERLPCARGSSWYPDRDFCVSLATSPLRGCSFCVSFPRTPKGSRAHVRRLGILTVCFVYIRQMRHFGVNDLCEFSQDPERLPCARLASWCPDRVFCVSPANAIF